MRVSSISYIALRARQYPTPLFEGALRSAQSGVTSTGVLLSPVECSLHHHPAVARLFTRRLLHYSKKPSP